MSRDPQKIKNIILNEFNILSDQHGYAKTTMAMLSKACGMSIGNISHYFKKKDELIVESFYQKWVSVFRIIRSLSGNLDDILQTHLLRVIILGYLCNQDEKIYCHMAEIPETIAVIESINNETYVTLAKACRQLKLPINELQIQTAAICAVCSAFMMIRRSYFSDLPLNYYHIFQVYCEMIFSQFNYEEIVAYEEKTLDFFEKLDKDHFIENYNQLKSEM